MEHYRQAILAIDGIRTARTLRVEKRLGLCYPYFVPSSICGFRSLAIVLTLFENAKSFPIHTLNPSHR